MTPRISERKRTKDQELPVKLPVLKENWRSMGGFLRPLLQHQRAVKIRPSLEFKSFSNDTLKPTRHEMSQWHKVIAAMDG